MVCCGALGLVLLFLLPPTVGAEVRNLLNIIDHLEKHYGNVGNQYALGINVPAQYCRENAKLDNNFLHEDKDHNVKSIMDTHKVYNGKQLIGANPKPIPGKTDPKGKPIYYHSEYLLLINSRPDESKLPDELMKHLLKKDSEGCTVFFTQNSPCVKTCSTPKDQKHPYSIIPALTAFRDHKGPKAFVFRQVWHHDNNKAEWEQNISVINKLIPVYRCDEEQCFPCVNKNVVNNKCKTNSG